MKNKFLSLTFLLFSGYAFAQIAEEKPQTPANSNPGSTPSGTEQGNFKPEAGDFTLEVDFSPFSPTIISLNYLRGRLFLSESMAARTGVSISFKSSGGSSTVEYALIPGIEKHFSGTGRLSPFIGAEMNLAGRSSTFQESDDNGTVTVKGSNDNGQGFFNFGLNGIAGCDFYFAKRIYTGIEVGYGLNIISTSSVVSTYVPKGGGTTTTETQPGGSLFQMGPNFNSALRLGFLF